MSTATESFREIIGQELANSINRMIENGEIHDFSPASARASARVASEAMRKANRVNDRMGPFYTSAKVARIGGISPQAVSERARKNTLLRMKTSDDTYVFPAFQFTATGQVNRKIRDVFRILLDRGVDPWTVAYWLTSPLSEFGGKTAVDLVEDGIDANRKLADLAQLDAESLTT